LSEREPCCPDDYGGSHYHCPYCGCVSSYQGHFYGDPPKLDCPPEDKRPAWAVEHVTEEVAPSALPEPEKELN
jgi:hypothetical protein